MVIVVATVEVARGKRSDFITAFQENVPNVLAEDGCIEYAPAVDVPTDIPVQVPVRSETVTIVEKWRDLDALKVHLVAPHMATYREKVKDLVQSVQLQVLEPVE